MRASVIAYGTARVFTLPHLFGEFLVATKLSVYIAKASASTLLRRTSRIWTHSMPCAMLSVIASKELPLFGKMDKTFW